MAVYIIHLEEPLGNEKHKANHYIGFTFGKDRDAVVRRANTHSSSRGSSFLSAANLKGIHWFVTRWFPLGDRTFERKIKNFNNSKMLCPICAGKKKMLLRGTSSVIPRKKICNLIPSKTEVPH